MRSLKQRELGGLVAFLILIWIIIGVPKRVYFNLTAATAEFTTALMTKSNNIRKHKKLHINYGTQTTIPQERRVSTLIF